MKAGTALAANRLVRRLAGLRREGRKAFVAYIMAGLPDWPTCLETVRELERAGAAAVELGVPFSDPIADGPVIQRAGSLALQAGVDLQQILEGVAELRRSCQLPLLLMGYWNVFLAMGPPRLLEEARSAGVDGFIIPDLPPEADPGFFAGARRDELCTVLLACSLTREPRLERLLEAATGFLYYVPQLGVTGQSLKGTSDLGEALQRVRALSELPVLVGIGVRSREEVERITAVADGVVVGTRIVEQILAEEDPRSVPARVAALARSLMP